VSANQSSASKLFLLFRAFLKKVKNISMLVHWGDARKYGRSVFVRL